MGLALILSMPAFAAVMAQLPRLTALPHWSGITFLLYLSWQLARNDGRLAERGTSAPAPPDRGRPAPASRTLRTTARAIQARARHRPAAERSLPGLGAGFAR